MDDPQNTILLHTEIIEYCLEVQNPALSTGYFLKKAEMKHKIW